MTSLGTLEIGLKLDRMDFDSSLQRVKQDLVNLNLQNQPIKISIKTEDKEIINLKKNLESIQTKIQLVQEQLKPLIVSVNDENLTKLNKHLEKKKIHTQEIQQFFNTNPLKPQKDDTALTTLNNKLNIISDRYKQLQAQFNKNQKWNIDIIFDLPNNKTLLPKSSVENVSSLSSTQTNSAIVLPNSQPVNPLLKEQNRLIESKNNLTNFPEFKKQSVLVNSDVPPALENAIHQINFTKVPEPNNFNEIVQSIQLLPDKIAQSVSKYNQPSLFKNIFSTLSGIGKTAFKVGDAALNVGAMPFKLAGSAITAPFQLAGNIIGTSKDAILNTGKQIAHYLLDNALQGLIIAITEIPGIQISEGIGRAFQKVLAGTIGDLNLIAESLSSKMISGINESYTSTKTGVKNTFSNVETLGDLTNKVNLGSLGNLGDLLQKIQLGKSKKDGTLKDLFNEIPIPNMNNVIQQVESIPSGIREFIGTEEVLKRSNAIYNQQTTQGREETNQARQGVLEKARDYEYGTGDTVSRRTQIQKLQKQKIPLLENKEELNSYLDSLNKERQSLEEEGKTLVTGLKSSQPYQSFVSARKSLKAQKIDYGEIEATKQRLFLLTKELNTTEDPIGKKIIQKEIDEFSQYLKKTISDYTPEQQDAIKKVEQLESDVPNEDKKAIARIAQIQTQISSNSTQKQQVNTYLSKNQKRINSIDKEITILRPQSFQNNEKIFPLLDERNRLIEKSNTSSLSDYPELKKQYENINDQRNPLIEQLNRSPEFLNVQQQTETLFSPFEKEGLPLNKIYEVRKEQENIQETLQQDLNPEQKKQLEDRNQYLSSILTPIKHRITPEAENSLEQVKTLHTNLPESDKQSLAQLEPLTQQASAILQQINTLHNEIDEQENRIKEIDAEILQLKNTSQKQNIHDEIAQLQPETISPAYYKIVSEVYGRPLEPHEIPKLNIHSDDKLSVGGKTANAYYTPITNSINVNRTLGQAILNNQLTPEQYNTITHELRHSLDTDSGSAKGFIVNQNQGILGEEIKPSSLEESVIKTIKSNPTYTEKDYSREIPAFIQGYRAEWRQTLKNLVGNEGFVKSHKDIGKRLSTLSNFVAPLQQNAISINNEESIGLLPELAVLNEKIIQIQENLPQLQESVNIGLDKKSNMDQSNSAILAVKQTITNINEIKTQILAIDEKLQKYEQLENELNNNSSIAIDTKPSAPGLIAHQSMGDEPIQQFINPQQLILPNQAPINPQQLIIPNKEIEKEPNVFSDHILEPKNDLQQTLIEPSQIIQSNTQPTSEVQQFKQNLQEQAQKLLTTTQGVDIQDAAKQILTSLEQMNDLFVKADRLFSLSDSGSALEQSEEEFLDDFTMQIQQTELFLQKLESEFNDRLFGDIPKELPTNPLATISSELPTSLQTQSTLAAFPPVVDLQTISNTPLNIPLNIPENKELIPVENKSQESFKQRLMSLDEELAQPFNTSHYDSSIEPSYTNQSDDFELGRHLLPNISQKNIERTITPNQAVSLQIPSNHTVIDNINPQDLVLISNKIEQFTIGLRSVSEGIKKADQFSQSLPSIAEVYKNIASKMLADIKIGLDYLPKGGVASAPLLNNRKSLVSKYQNMLDEVTGAILPVNLPEIVTKQTGTTALKKDNTAYKSFASIDELFSNPLFTQLPVERQIPIVAESKQAVTTGREALSIAKEKKNIIKGTQNEQFENVFHSIEQQIQTFETTHGIDLNEVGKDLITGLGQGILSEATRLKSIMESIGTESENILRDVTETHSPSEMFKRIGRDWGLGILVGGESTKSNILEFFKELGIKSSQQFTENLLPKSAQIPQHILNYAMDYANKIVEEEQVKYNKLNIHPGIVTPQEDILSKAQKSADLVDKIKIPPLNLEDYRNPIEYGGFNEDIDSFISEVQKRNDIFDATPENINKLNANIQGKHHIFEPIEGIDNGSLQSLQQDSRDPLTQLSTPGQNRLFDPTPENINQLLLRIQKQYGVFEPIEGVDDIHDLYNPKKPINLSSNYISPSIPDPWLEEEPIAPILPQLSAIKSIQHMNPVELILPHQQTNIAPNLIIPRSQQEQQDELEKIAREARIAYQASKQSNVILPNQEITESPSLILPTQATEPQNLILSEKYLDQLRKKQTHQSIITSSIPREPHELIRSDLPLVNPPSLIIPNQLPIKSHELIRSDLPLVNPPSLIIPNQLPVNSHELIRSDLPPVTPPQLINPKQELENLVRETRLIHQQTSNASKQLILPNQPLINSPELILPNQPPINSPELIRLGQPVTNPQALTLPQGYIEQLRNQSGLIIRPNQTPVNPQQLILPNQTPVNPQQLILPNQTPVNPQQLILPNQTPVNPQQLILPNNPRTKSVSYPQLYKLESNETSPWFNNSPLEETDPSININRRRLPQTAIHTKLIQIENEINSGQQSDIEKKAAKIENRLPPTSLEWGISQKPNLFSGISEAFGGGLKNILSMVSVVGLLEVGFQAVAFSIQNSVFALVNMANESLSIAENLERVKIKLNFIEDNATKSKDIFKSFAEQSKTLGTNLEITTSQYIDLKQATTGTILEPQSKKIIDQFQQSFTAQQLDQSSRNQAIGVITDIASGTPITPEKLTRTFSQALPGGLEIAARSQGLSQDQFLQLAQQGGLNRETFLPRLAQEAQIESQGKLEDALNSPLVKIDQFSARIKELQDNLGQGTLSAIGNLLTPLNALFDIFAKNSTIITAFSLVIGNQLLSPFVTVINLAKGLTSAVFGLFMQLGMTPGEAIFNGLKTGLRVLGTEVIKLGVSFAAFYAAIKAFELGKQFFFDQDEDIKKERDKAENRLKTVGQTPEDKSKVFNIENYKPTTTGDFWGDFNKNVADIQEQLKNNPNVTGLDKIKSAFTVASQFYSLPEQERNSANVSKTIQADINYANSQEIKQYSNPEFNKQVQQEIGNYRSQERHLLREIEYKEETGQDATKDKAKYNQIQEKEQSVITTKFPQLANLQAAKDSLEKTTIPDIIKGSDTEAIKNEKLTQAYKALAGINTAIDQINPIINQTGTAWLALNRKIFDISQTFANLDYKLQNETALAHIDILGNQIQGQYGQQGAQLSQFQLDNNIGKEKEQTYKTTLKIEYAELRKNLEAQASGSSMSNAQEFAKPNSLGKNVIKSIQSGDLSPQSIQAFIEKYQGKTTFSPDQLGILKYAKQVAEDQQKYLDILQGNKQTELNLIQVQIAITQAAKLRLNSLVQSLADFKNTQADIAKNQAVVSLNRLQASGSIGSLAAQGQTAQINVSDSSARFAAANDQLKGLLDNLDKYDAKTISQFKDILGVSQNIDLKNYLQKTSANSIEARFANPTPEQAGLIETGNPNLIPLKETGKEIANTAQQSRQSNEGQSAALKEWQDFQVSLQDSLVSLAKNIRGLNESFADMGRTLNKQLLDAQNALKEAQANLSANQFKVDVQGILTPGHSGFFRELEGIINDYVSQINQINSQSNRTQSDRLSVQDQTIQLTREIRNLEEQRVEASREMAKSLLGTASLINGQSDLQVKTWEAITSKIGSAGIYAGKIADIFAGILGKFQGKKEPTNQELSGLAPNQKGQISTGNISPLSVPSNASNPPISSSKTNGIPPEIRAFEEIIGFAETRDYKDPYKAGPAFMPQYKLNLNQFPTDLKSNWNYGRYQNDNEDAQYYGFKKKYKDLSPANQDKMTADILSDEQRFPGGLEAIKKAFSTRKLEDLQKAFDIYNKFWVSLPGGSQNGNGQNIEANLPNLAKVGYRAINQLQSSLPVPALPPITQPTSIINKPTKPIEPDEGLGQFNDNRQGQVPVTPVQTETQQIIFTQPALPIEQFNQPFNLPAIPSQTSVSPTITSSEFSDKVQKIESLNYQRNDVEKKNIVVQTNLAGQDASNKLENQRLDTLQKIRENQRQYLDIASRSVNELQNILDKAKGYQTYQEQINQAARETTQEYKAQKESIEDNITQFERMRDSSTENIKTIQQQIDLLTKQGKPIPIELTTDIKTGQELNKQIDQLIGKDGNSGLLQQRLGAVQQAEPIARQSTQSQETLNKAIQAQQELTKIRSDFVQAKIENGDDPLGALGQEAAILQAKLDNLARTKDAEEMIRGLGGEAVLGAAKVKELRDTVDQTNQLKLEQAQRNGNKFEANFQSGFEQLFNGSTTLFGRGGGKRELELLSESVKTMFSGLTEQASKAASKFITSLIFGNQGTGGSPIDAIGGINVRQAISGNAEPINKIAPQNLSNNPLGLTSSLQGIDFSNVNDLTTNLTNLSVLDFTNANSFVDTLLGVGNTTSPTGKQPQNQDILSNWLGINNQTSSAQTNGTGNPNENPIQAAMVALTGNKDFSNTNPISAALAALGNNSGSQTSNNPLTQAINQISGNLTPKPINLAQNATDNTLSSSMSGLNQQVVALTQSFANLNAQVSTNGNVQPSNQALTFGNNNNTPSINFGSNKNSSYTNPINNDLRDLSFTKPRSPLNFGGSATSRSASSPLSSLKNLLPKSQPSDYLGIPGLQINNGLFQIADTGLLSSTASLGSNIGIAGANALDAAAGLIDSAGAAAGSLLGGAFDVGSSAASDAGLIFSDFIFNKGGLVPNYAGGGQVDYSALGAQAAAALNREQSASGKTPVLAALTPGEYVVPLHEVPAYLKAKESGVLQAGNYFDGGKVQQEVANFDKGGLVGTKPTSMIKTHNYFTGGKLQHEIENFNTGGLVGTKPASMIKTHNYFDGGKEHQEVANFDKGGIVGTKPTSMIKTHNYFTGGKVQHEIENFNTGGLVNYKTQNYETGGYVKNVENFVKGGTISSESSYIQEGHKKSVENHFKGGVVENIFNYADGGVIRNIHNSPNVSSAMNINTLGVNPIQLKPYLQTQPLNNISVRNYSSGGYVNPTIYSPSQVRTSDGQNSTVVNNNWNVNYTPNSQDSLSDSQIKARNQAQMQRSIHRFGV